MGSCSHGCASLAVGYNLPPAVRRAAPDPLASADISCLGDDKIRVVYPPSPSRYIFSASGNVAHLMWFGYETATIRSSLRAANRASGCS